METIIKTVNRPFTFAVTKLRDAGLRPTRQRMALAKLLFENEHGCHITAEGLHRKALKEGIPVSLATIYNTLHQFTEAAILKEIIVNSGLSYFDSNTSNHHHYYFEKSKVLEDIPHGALSLSGEPPIPKGMKISRIDIIVRVE